MSPGERKQPVRIRRARVGDIDEFARIVQLVADEGRYIFTEKVTDERKRSMLKVFKDKPASWSSRRSGPGGTGGSSGT